MTEICCLCHSTTEKDLGNFKNPNLFKANIKFDGERILAKIQDGQVTLYNRRGRNKNKQYPEVVNDLKHFKNCWLDGEVISLDDNFNKLQHRSNTQDGYKISLMKKEIPVKFMVFDLLRNGDEDLTNKPLAQRVSFRWETIETEKLVKLKAVEFVTYGEVEVMYQRAKQENREGIIVKNMESPYEFKRSKNWLKCKFWKQAEITLQTYTENPAGIRCEDKKGNAVQVSGQQHQAVKQALDTKGCCEVVIQYLEMTKNGRYRHPTFKQIKQKQFTTDDVALMEEKCYVDSEWENYHGGLK